MVKVFTKLASALTSKADKAAYKAAMIEMDNCGIPVVELTDVKVPSTCPEVETTRQSSALILVSKENRTR